MHCVMHCVMHDLMHYVMHDGMHYIMHYVMHYVMHYIMHYVMLCFCLLVERAQVLRDQRPGVLEEPRHLVCTWCAHGHGVHMVCTWCAHSVHMLCTWCAHRARAAREEDASVDVGHRAEVGPQQPVAQQVRAVLLQRAGVARVRLEQQVVRLRGDEGEGVAQQRLSGR